MDWIQLTSEQQLDAIVQKSFEKPQVLFKHSTRCSISSTALQRLEKAQPPAGVDFHLLDLLSYRNISKKIADRFRIDHESPQVLVIKNGVCIYDESHLGIYMADIADLAIAS